MSSELTHVHCLDTRMHKEKVHIHENTNIQACLPPKMHTHADLKAARPLHLCTLHRDNLDPFGCHKARDLERVLKATTLWPMLEAHVLAHTALPHPLNGHLGPSHQTQQQQQQQQQLQHRHEGGRSAEGGGRFGIRLCRGRRTLPQQPLPQARHHHHHYQQQQQQQQGAQPSLLGSLIPSPFRLFGRRPTGVHVRVCDSMCFYI